MTIIQSRLDTVLQKLEDNGTALVQSNLLIELFGVIANTQFHEIDFSANQTSKPEIKSALLKLTKEKEEECNNILIKTGFHFRTCNGYCAMEELTSIFRGVPYIGAIIDESNNPRNLIEVKYFPSQLHRPVVKLKIWYNHWHKVSFNDLNFGLHDIDDHPQKLKFNLIFQHISRDSGLVKLIYEVKPKIRMDQKILTK
jgi:hypothetical protein